jgi:hypothetical protein
LFSVHHPVIHVKRLPSGAPVCRSRTFLTISDNKVVGIVRDAVDESDEKEQVRSSRNICSF